MKFILLILLYITAYNCQYVRRRNDYKRMINRFAFNIYKQTTTEKPGNVIISPYSVQSALAMTLLGATDGSETKAEMLNGLKHPQNFSKQQISENYRQQNEKFNENDNLKIANKIFINQQFTIKPSFQSLVLNGFNSSAENVDFSKSQEASSTINQWVERQTNGKIVGIITPDMCDEATAMILVNTIYYKGIWKYKFNEKNHDGTPIKDDFHISRNKSVKIDFMNMKKDLYFGEINDYGIKALRLPYKDPEISMMLILPNLGIRLADIERTMTSQYFSDIWDQMTTTKVDVKIPKFKIEFTAELNESLKKIGMRKMFTNTTEFGDLIENFDNFSISKIVHKSVIEVNAEGTEAAAATGVVALIVGGQSNKVFYANRPFLFYLVSNRTKQIIFMGKVAKLAAQ